MKAIPILCVLFLCSCDWTEYYDFKTEITYQTGRVDTIDFTVKRDKMNELYISPRLNSSGCLRVTPGGTIACGVQNYRILEYKKR